MDDAFERRLVREFFFEQEHEAVSISYRHGWLRTAFVLARSLFLPSRRQPRNVGPGDTVGVAFFPNELSALERAPAAVGVTQILKLDLRRLPIVRAQLGLWGTVGALRRFASLVVREKGFAYLRRASMPALGWLLYHAFLRILSPRPGTTVITTNMVHPTSIGIHWAAVTAGCRSVFWEHATTPGLIMNARGYHGVYVNFEHTRELLVSKGFGRETVHVLGSIDAQRVSLPASVRAVAICINGYDAIESVIDVSDALQERGFAVIYRVHDADPRVGELTRVAAARGYGMSLARKSSIQSFLQSVDLVITGNSNVIADALIAGKPVVYYWAGSEDMFDYYGFIQHYGLLNARSKQSLKNILAGLAQAAAC